MATSNSIAIVIIKTWHDKFGISSIAGGYIVFGVSVASNFTVCSSTSPQQYLATYCRATKSFRWCDVYLRRWRVVWQWNGAKHLSYPDNVVRHVIIAVTAAIVFFISYIVLGAEKHDAGVAYPSYNGFMDELRISNIIRYTSNFTPATNAYSPDANTMALYHFNEGTGTVINDVSGASGGPSNGFINIGGSTTGPIWSADSPFTGMIPTLTMME